MKVSQLRDLTRRAAEHRVSREDYLLQRKRLIDGMISGEIEIVYRELDPGKEAATGRTNHGWGQRIGGSLLLVCLLFAALVAYFFDSNSSRHAATPAVKATIADPGVELLANFMKRNEWSEHALQRFEEEWASAQAFHKESARRSIEYRKLRNETRQRIREQEALVAAGEPEALLRVARLKDFATAIGFGSET